MKGIHKVKFKILMCASLFFVQNVFSTSLSSTEIRILGTDEQMSEIRTLFAEASMRSESVITIQKRMMVRADDKNIFVMVNFRDNDHLAQLAQMVPQVSKGKVVFVCNPDASDDYHDAITSCDGSVLTYREFFSIGSEAPIQISGNINAPGAFFHFLSPSTRLTSGSMVYRSHWSEECNLEGSVREFSSMSSGMTPGNVVESRQFLETALVERNEDRVAQGLASMSLTGDPEEGDYPSIEKVVHGAIAGEGLSAVPFDSVHIQGSAVRVSSDMHGLIALREQFRHLYPTGKLIDVILGGYDGVYFREYANPEIGKGWLIQSDRDMFVVNLPSSLSSEYDWVFQSGGNMGMKGDIPNTTISITTAENLTMDQRPADYNEPDRLLDEWMRDRTEATIIRGEAPR